MNRFSADSAKLYIEELATTAPATAREYLLKKGYSSSSFDMPEYYGARHLEQVQLTPIDWQTNPPLITKPLNFLTPKGSLSWRSFNLLHPYIYIHLVNELTTEEAWEVITSKLCTETSVCCYSTPSFSVEEDETSKGNNISRWIQMTENDIVKDSVNFAFLSVTDIKNFYPSVYTHSISWAIHGKKVAKQNRFVKALLGNKLDKLFQNARDGQTNGIPVGSMVSDIIAEIILKDIDVLLTEVIKSEKLTDQLVITRYRDDYRILSKTNEQGRFIIKSLSKILDEYNLSLNSDKTHVYEDVIEGSFRDWSREIGEDTLLRAVKYGTLGSTVTASELKDVLLKTYHLQRKYPQGRSSITLLTKLTAHLSKTDVSIEVDKIDVHTIISILRKLALIQEEVSAQTYLLLDVLLHKIDDETLIHNLILELLEVIKGSKDHDYQVIWLYRLCLSNAIYLCPTVMENCTSPLIDLLNAEYQKNTKCNYEVFSEVEGLTEADKAELCKFKYVDQDMLEAANEVAIDREFYDVFKY